MILNKAAIHGCVDNRQHDISSITRVMALTEVTWRISLSWINRWKCRYPSGRIPQRNNCNSNKTQGLTGWFIHCLKRISHDYIPVKRCYYNLLLHHFSIWNLLPWFPMLSAWTSRLLEAVSGWAAGITRKKITIFITVSLSFKQCNPSWNELNHKDLILIMMEKAYRESMLMSPLNRTSPWTMFSVPQMSVAEMAISTMFQ